jgi:hypothetical protein
MEAAQAPRCDRFCGRISILSPKAETDPVFFLWDFEIGSPKLPLKYIVSFADTKYMHMDVRAGESPWMAKAYFLRSVGTAPPSSLWSFGNRRWAVRGNCA